MSDCTCETCANYAPKPAFKAGDWVVGVGGEPFELNHPSLAYAMNGDGAMVAVVRHARLSDFEKTVNGVKVLMKVEGEPRHVVGIVTDGINTGTIIGKSADLLATALGVTIAPAGLE